MELIISFKKTVIYSIILTFICSIFLFVLTFYRQNSTVESSIEFSILTIGLILFSKFEKNKSLEEFIKGLFITFFYGIAIGSLTQVLNPTSELKTVTSFFLFSLTYNYIILIGLTVLLLKFAYNTVYRKRIESREKE